MPLVHSCGSWHKCDVLLPSLLAHVICMRCKDSPGFGGEGCCSNSDFEPRSEENNSGEARKCFCHDFSTARHRIIRKRAIGASGETNMEYLLNGGATVFTAFLVDLSQH